MADFCKQCSIAIFAKDYGDLANLSTEEHTRSRIYSIVICESCGPTQVDHTGECVNADCVYEHGKKA